MLVMHCWGGINRGGGWEKWSNRSGLTCECKVINLINIRNFSCKLEADWLSLTEVKELFL